MDPNEYIGQVCAVARWRALQLAELCALPRQSQSSVAKLITAAKSLTHKCQLGSVRTCLDCLAVSVLLQTANGKHKSRQPKRIANAFFFPFFCQKLNAKKNTFYTLPNDALLQSVSFSFKVNLLTV